MKPKQMLMKLYSAFSKQEEDVNARCSALIQAVGIMTNLCGTLRVLQTRNPALAYVPPESDKLWDRANKCKARALGTPFEHEKETSLRMCLKILQKMAEKARPPKLEEYEAKLEARQKAKAERAASQAAAQARRVAQPQGAGATTMRRKRSGKPMDYPSNLAPLGPDGVPQWRPGSSADIITKVLFSQPQITKAEVVAQVVGKFPSTNLVCRVTMVAGFLIKFGKLRRVKINGAPGWERI